MEEANADHDNNLRVFLDRVSRTWNQVESRQARLQERGSKVHGSHSRKRWVESGSRQSRSDREYARTRECGSTSTVCRNGQISREVSPVIVRHERTPASPSPTKTVNGNGGSEQQAAFDMIKRKVCEAPVLKYFDPKCATEGQGDASQNGLGFVLLQNGQPVAYASRALTPAEQRYSQIEKELLAQVFGLERHHEFVYGREIALWTDHKPLVAITQKPLATAPKRLQRLLLRLNQYTVKIQYMPGPQLYVADTLSRAYINDTQQSETETEIESIHLIDGLRISDATKREIQQMTAEDSALQTVMQYISEGWPTSIAACTIEARPYYGIRHEMTMDDGIVFKGPTMRHSSCNERKNQRQTACRTYRYREHTQTRSRVCFIGHLSRQN